MGHMSEIHKVGILGAGTMGRGIAASIPVMLYEHSIYREFLKEFEETLLLLRRVPESMALRDRLLDIGREWVQLTGHIHKEERILFMLANDQASPAAVLLRRVDALVRRPAVGRAFPR